MPSLACRICHADAPHATLPVREMQLGLRSTFEYFDCRACGCLQIADLPDDMTPYYPREYYSFTPSTGRGSGAFGRALVRARNRAAVFGGPWYGRLLLRRFPQPELAGLRPLALDRASRILDVGAGAGNLLVALAAAGFARLDGIDAYLPADHAASPGVTVRRASLAACDGPYDLVMFHHSFEHMPDPHAQLAQVARILAPGGRCLLRLPTADSFAFRHYGADWVQLDAPRHFFLHTPNSLEILARACGFRVAAIRDTSTAFQFWGSEQYRADIPLFSERSWAVHPRRSPFTSAQVRAFEDRARTLNRAREGDEFAAELVRA